MNHTRQSILETGIRLDASSTSSVTELPGGSRMKRLWAIVCLFRGHYSTMIALPEHGFGLYAFSWLGCGRCGRTEAENKVAFAPCWQCPEGKCDHCEDCATAAGLFGLVDKMASGTLRVGR